jgi:hypothetical protein
MASVSANADAPSRKWCRLTRPLRTIAIGAVAACGASDEPAAEPGRTWALDEVLSWERRFDLEERPEALVVLPAVSIDPLGGFLVADQREAQVRRYSPDGRLLWFTGKRGGGPGEFYVPSAAARLPSGKIVTIDRNGRITTFDSAGSRVVGTADTRITAGTDLKVVDDSTLLIAGNLNGDRDGPRLHLWNVTAGRVERSFFAPYPNAADKIVSYIAGWTKASIRHDTVAAIFSTSDTVYFYTLDGRPHGKLPIPSAFFRREPVPPPDANRPDPAARLKWMSQFDFIENVFWLQDGSFLIPYQTPRETTADERRSHLLAVTRNGRLRFETRDGPRLLNVESGSDALYFVNPGAEVPNQWAVARLRR